MAGFYPIFARHSDVCLNNGSVSSAAGRIPLPLPGPCGPSTGISLNWLEHERGFSVGSLKNRKYSLLTFLRWWEPKNRPLFCLRVVDLDDFLAACHAQGLSRVGVLNVANATRSFLRYAEIRRLCSPGLADAFHGPTIYSREGLPRGPSGRG
ncbi:MAG: site-specific integrase [Elusimicrobia bacterium]|nr:site-specific integrase [Elusimicrobiota bacterium]